MLMMSNYHKCSLPAVLQLIGSNDWTCGTISVSRLTARPTERLLRYVTGAAHEKRVRTGKREQPPSLSVSCPNMPRRPDMVP